MDKDYLLAVKLSKEINSLNNVYKHNNNKSPIRNKIERYGKYAGENDRPDLNSTNNLVHPDWETIDPTPDIHTMFGAFDLKFFQGKLQCVTLEWSKRMYNCAGICYSRKNNLGMQCTIRLSEPLLKLRSRKNLIETLLHEMIHAYLFINGIREANGGHGPNFKKMMEGINRAAGTHITVYHTFYDEVNLYKNHWWRCNGICQHRKPFFGYVKRTCNRAPGPSDMWWKTHHDSCSGTFEKVKEPEKTKKNSKISATGKITKRRTTAMPKGEIKANNVPDIRMYYPTKQNSPMKHSGNEHINPSKTGERGGNLSNVVGFKDLPTSDDENQTSPHSKTKDIELFTGQGRSLCDIPIGKPSSNIKGTVRDIWARRFAGDSSKDASSSKRPRLAEQISEEDDLILIEQKPPLVDILDSDEEEERCRNVRAVMNTTSQEKQNEIINDIKSSTQTYNDDDVDVIDLIDGDFDDSIVNDPTELIDKKVMDDLFGEDTLLNRYQTTSTSRDNDLICLTENNIIHCPLCQERLSRNDLASHLEGCMGIKVEVKRVNYKVPGKLPFYKNKAVKRQMVIDDDSDDEWENQVVDAPQPANSNLETVCPVCNVLQQGDINAHLDFCLAVSFDD